MPQNEKNANEKQQDAILTEFLQSGWPEIKEILEKNGVGKGPIGEVENKVIKKGTTVKSSDGNTAIANLFEAIQVVMFNEFLAHYEAMRKSNKDAPIAKILTQLPSPAIATAMAKLKARLDEEENKKHRTNDERMAQGGIDSFNRRLTDEVQTAWAKVKSRSEIPTNLDKSEERKKTDSRSILNDYFKIAKNFKTGQEHAPAFVKKLKDLVIKVKVDDKEKKVEITSADVEKWLAPLVGQKIKSEEYADFAKEEFQALMAVMLLDEFGDQTKTLNGNALTAQAKELAAHLDKLGVKDTDAAGMIEQSKAMNVVFNDNQKAALLSAVNANSAEGGTTATPVPTAKVKEAGPLSEIKKRQARDLMVQFATRFGSAPADKIKDEAAKVAGSLGKLGVSAGHLELLINGTGTVLEGKDAKQTKLREALKQALDAEAAK